jgi:hypothetical protein
VSSGTLEFGLKQSDIHPTAPVTGISGINDVVLTGTEVDIFDLGDLGGATSGDIWTLMVWSGTRTGEATLDDTPVGLTFTLLNNADSLQLEFGGGPAVGTTMWLK